MEINFKKGEEGVPCWKRLGIWHCHCCVWPGFDPGLGTSACCRHGEKKKKKKRKEREETKKMMIDTEEICKGDSGNHFFAFLGVLFVRAFDSLFYYYYYYYFTN